MSQLYILKIKVIKDHLDDLNHVNNVQYLIWSQEIAKAHWQKINNKINIEGVWMVRSHEVEYRLGAFLNDEIRNLKIENKNLNKWKDLAWNKVPTHEMLEHINDNLDNLSNYLKGSNNYTLKHLSSS